MASIPPRHRRAVADYYEGQNVRHVLSGPRATDAEGIRRVGGKRRSHPVLQFGGERVGETRLRVCESFEQEQYHAVFVLLASPVLSK